MANDQDWGSAVLRDLGLPADPSPAPRSEDPPPPQGPSPDQLPEPPPEETPSPDQVPEPPAEVPPSELDEAPSKTAELPVVVLDAAPARPGPEVPPAGTAPLDPERFTRARHHREPVVRRTVHRVREVLGVDASKEVREAIARAERLRQPVTTIRRLAVFSTRGGAGRTTVATLLATTLAAARHDRVLAADATPGLGSLRPDPPSPDLDGVPGTGSPDLGAVPGLGSLALRAGGRSPATMQEVANAAGRLRSFAEAEPHLGRADGGLWVLTGDGGRLDPPAYSAAVAALSRFFAVLVTDCGPDAGSDLNLGILLDAHALALATPATVDGLVGAHQALAWLRQTPAAALVPRTVVVLTTQTPHTDGVDLKRGTRTLASHGVRVARLPYDRHLAAGARIHPGLLGQRTRDAVIALAADLLSFAVSDRGGW